MKEQDTSTIHLPINVLKEDIEKTINQLVTDIVYEDKDIKDDGLMIRARKSQDIKIYFEEDTIRYQIVLAIWLKKDLGLTNAEANGEISVEMSTNYAIQEDWQLKTSTEVLNHHWLKKPKMKLGFLDVSIKYLANKIIQRSKDAIGEALDRQLVQRFNLRHYIQNAWNTLQTPIRISEAYGLFLQVQPEALSMSPLLINDSEINSKVLIQAITNVSFGEMPDSATATSLPGFDYTDTNEDSFNIQLGAKISYKALELLASKYLIGKSFSFEIGSVIPREVFLKWQGKKLLGDIRLSGSYEGNVKISARPIFDTKKNEVRFEDLELVLKTSNIFHKGIGWLFQNSLERRISKALKFPLQTRMETLKRALEQKLHNYKINENVLLNGQIKDLEIRTVYFNAESIDVLFASHGNLEVQLF